MYIFVLLVLLVNLFGVIDSIAKEDNQKKRLPAALAMLVYAIAVIFMFIIIFK